MEPRDFKTERAERIPKKLRHSTGVLIIRGYCYGWGSFSAEDGAVTVFAVLRYVGCQENAA